MKIVTPDDSRYALLRSSYTRVSSPAVVLLPTSTDEVREALAYARERGLPITLRSGGHGLAPKDSDGGAVIDLSGLDRVDVLDRTNRLVRVEAGARWARVAAALRPHGLAISSGDHGNVGAGGLATGGGVGWLVRSFGLTIDRVRAVDVLLADGTLVRADASHEPDLFWAVRGAGAGVGIVLAFEIEAAEVTDVGLAQIALLADPDGSTLTRWRAAVAEAPRSLSTMALLMPYGDATVLQITAVTSDGDLTPAGPLTKIGKLLDASSGVVPYTSLVPTAHLHPNVGQQPAITTNGLLTLTRGSARAIMTASNSAFVQLRSMGGAVNDVPAEATAYPHRHQDTLAVATVFPPHGARALDATWRPVARHTDGAYVNFESRPAGNFDRVYPGATGDRVKKLRQHYDPDGILGVN
jgi:FAD/FMN-containing dehydrogenase